MGICALIPTNRQYVFGRLNTRALMTVLVLGQVSAIPKILLQQHPVEAGRQNDSERPALVEKKPGFWVAGLA